MNHFVSLHRSTSSFDEHDFSDPGLRALWLMHVNADGPSSARDPILDAGSEMASSNREGDMKTCGSATGLRWADRCPESDHPVDARLDTSLRLLALDTLQKQLVVISEIVAQEGLHGDADGHA